MPDPTGRVVPEVCTLFHRKPRAVLGLAIVEANPGIPCETLESKQVQDGAPFYLDRDKLRRARPSPDRRPAASPSSEPIKFIELETGKSLQGSQTAQRDEDVGERLSAFSLALSPDNAKHWSDDSDIRLIKVKIAAVTWRSAPSRLRPPWKRRPARRDACRSPYRPGRSPWPSRR